MLAGEDSLVQTIVDLKEKNHEELIRKMQIGFWMLLDEMSAMSKADIEHAKVVLTATVDHGRELYVEGYRGIPRRVVFVGTTNKPQFLRDPDGSRRFLPIHATKVDLDYLRDNREQLWAEAVYLFQSGYKWYEVRGSEAVQEAANMEDMFTETLLASLSQERYAYAKTTDGRLFITLRRAFEILMLDKRWPLKTGLVDK